MRPTIPNWTVPTPDGERGDWKIETFTLSADDVRLENLRAAISGMSAAHCSPGTYKRLVHRSRGCVMSDTPFEQRTNRTAFYDATGRVLINGLGLGMLLAAILRKRDVKRVRVIEHDADVIALVGPTFATDPRVQIVHACAFEYTPAKGEFFEFVWHDIWDDMSADNVPEMAKLKRKYSKKTPRQSAWGEYECKRQAASRYHR